MYESLEQAKLYHASQNLHWTGESLAEYKHLIWQLIKERKVKTILDYGSGKAKFHKLLFNNTKTPGAPMGIKITPYDPAYEPYSARPTNNFDMVICTDVMEHVQEDQVENVLKDIFSFSNFVFFSITCYPATQTLSNGKNAHYTIKAPEWWKEKLKPYENNLHVVFQTRPERGKIINKEEWVPNEETMRKLAEEKKGIKVKNLDPTQREKAGNLL